MHAHETQGSGSQPKAGTPKSNPFTPRPFEVTYPGQEIASSPTNPFPRRPHETWSAEPIASPKPAPPADTSAEPEPKRAEIDWSRVSLYAAGQTPPDPPKWKGIQAKLTIGRPNNPYEQEADRVADQVMTMPAPAFSVQRQTDSDIAEEAEAEGAIQTKPIADTITPLVQRQVEDEEETLQPKCEACEQEETVQRLGDRSASASPALESRLNASKGNGSPLPDGVRSFMEPRFGADFSQVRVHTGGDAVQMNREVGAQAFTHGSDVYFGAGKSPGNNELTAHELTHVVQQMGAKTLRQKLDTDRKSPKLSLQPKLNPVSDSLLQAKIELSHPINNRDNQIAAKQNTQSPALQLKCADYVTEYSEQKLDHHSLANKERLHTKLDSAVSLSATSTSTLQVKPQGNKDAVPNMQIKCAACEAEEEAEKTIQRKQISENITPYTQDNKAVQKFGWDDVKNAAGAGAQWVGDKAGQAASMGKDAFAALVARVAPGLADLMRQGPLGLLTEKIKEGVKSWVSGVASGVNIGNVIAGLKGSFTNVFETIKGAAKGDAASCAAFNQILGSLQEMGHAFMNSPVMKEIQAAFAKVGSVFKKINDAIISPAIDKVMQIAGSVVTGITNLATTIWEWGAPVRSALGAAWDWVKEKLGIISDGAGGVLSWLKTKAAEAWTKIQATLAPVIEPLKKVGMVLLAFSPVGLLAGAIKYGPQLIQAAQWLWAHRSDKDIVKHAREEMGNTILPQLLESLQGFAHGVQETATGFVHHITEIGQAVVGLLSSITGVPILSVAQGVVQTLANDIKQAVTWAQNTFQAAVQGVQEVFTKIKNVVGPYKELLLSIGLAIANPAMIPAILAYNAWKLIPDCYKQSLFKFLYDIFLGKHGIFLNGWKKLQESEAAFEAAAKVKLQELVDQIPDKTREAIETAMQKVSKPLQKHLKGIWSKLEPALQHLKANWWGEIKQMVWNLIWPFNEKSPLKKDVGELIHLPGEILKSLTSGNISTAIDQFLSLQQKLNSVIGLFYGWFTIASILVGAIIGAFFGGAGALPGAGAGLAFAGEVGEGLLIAMVATETAVIAKAVYDLAFGPESKQDSAYERIANSSLTLGITGVFVVLGELASEIASELVAGVKGLFKGAEGSEAGVKVNAPEVKGDVPEGKAEVPEVKGDTPEANPGSDFQSERPSLDGERKVKITEDGECLVCASPCDRLNAKYREEINANPKEKFEERINTADQGVKQAKERFEQSKKKLEGIQDPEAQKAEFEKAKQELTEAEKHLEEKIIEFEKVEQDLAEIRKKARENETLETKLEQLSKTESAAQESLKEVNKSLKGEKEKLSKQIEELRRSGKREDLAQAEQLRKLLNNDKFNNQLKELDAELKALSEKVKEAGIEDAKGDPDIEGLAKNEADKFRDEFDDLRTKAEELKGEIEKEFKPESKFDNQAFIEEIKKLSPSERVARVEEQAGKIASQKGFEKDTRLSRINNRTVYRDPATGDLYGVDTQHGTFEKCNADGIHQGEFNFADVQTDPADRSGGHNLKLN
ncbi:MAG: DUF4157 domain-containing protein [Scytolyngbya sp. HA4215-MV1]|jgi:hypothetical protein|nr:DUF4157 domain-containing protein [Scytolyngbya sp. HA4215-MV1]